MPSFRVLLMSLLCLSWSTCKPGKVFLQPIMLDTYQLEQCGARLQNDSTSEDQVETKEDTLRLRFKFGWGLAIVVLSRKHIVLQTYTKEKVVVPNQLEFLAVSRDSFILHLMHNILTFKAGVHPHTYPL